MMYMSILPFGWIGCCHVTSTDDGVRVNTSGARTPPGPEGRHTVLYVITIHSKNGECWYTV